MKKIFIVVMVTLLGFLWVGISTATANDVCGTGSPGYWMNHPDAWGTNIITWEVSSGTLIWSKENAIELMKAPTKGDKWLTLFQATVAAWLNDMNGCPPPPDPPDCVPLTQCWPNGVCEPLDQAILWLVSFYGDRPIRASSEPWQESHGEDTYLCLDNYNNGYFDYLGIPSRDSLE